MTRIKRQFLLMGEVCRILSIREQLLNPRNMITIEHHHQEARMHMDTHSGVSTDDPQRQTRQLCQEENMINNLAQAVEMLLLGLSSSSGQ